MAATRGTRVSPEGTPPPLTVTSKLEEDATEMSHSENAGEILRGGHRGWTNSEHLSHEISLQLMRNHQGGRQRFPLGSRVNAGRPSKPRAAASLVTRVQGEEQAVRGVVETHSRDCGVLFARTGTWSRHIHALSQVVSRAGNAVKNLLRASVGPAHFDASEK